MRRPLLTILLVIAALWLALMLVLVLTRGHGTAKHHRTPKPATTTQAPTVPQRITPPDTTVKPVAPADPAAPDYDLVDWADKKQVGRVAAIVGPELASLEPRRAAATLALLKPYVSGEVYKQAAVLLGYAPQGPAVPRGTARSTVLAADPQSGARTATLLVAIPASKAGPEKSVGIVLEFAPNAPIVTAYRTVSTGG